MSLARTAVRMAAVNALAGTDAATGPTIACNRVYDSRISDFSPETYPEDAKPVIIVLTDDDEGDALSEQNGGPPFHRNIKLVFEFAMVQGFNQQTNNSTEYVPGFPTTDAEHEASLDALEFQIARRLAYDPSDASYLFRSITTRVIKQDCHRQVMDDSGVKIAARILTWDLEVPDDDVAVYGGAGSVVPTGLDVLPEPLRTVAKALPDGAAKDICTKIALAIGSLNVGPLNGIDFTTNNGDPSDNVSGTISLGLSGPSLDFSDPANSGLLAAIGV